MYGGSCDPLPASAEAAGIALKKIARDLSNAGVKNLKAVPEFTEAANNVIEAARGAVEVQTTALMTLAVPAVAPAPELAALEEQTRLLGEAVTKLSDMGQTLKSIDSRIKTVTNQLDVTLKKGDDNNAALVGICQGVERICQVAAELSARVSGGFVHH